MPSLDNWRSPSPAPISFFFRQLLHLAEGLAQRFPQPVGCSRSSEFLAVCRGEVSDAMK